MLIASPNVTAAVAAAQAAAAAAAASASSASASAALAASYADSDVGMYPTKASVQVATIPSATLAIRTAGYTSAGDLGGALYVRVTSEPALAGKIRSTDRYLPNGNTDNTNGGWWQIKETTVTPQMFGAVMDGITNDYQAIMDAIEHRLVGAGGAPTVYFPGGQYKVNSTIELYRAMRLVGPGTGHDGYEYTDHGAELIFAADTMGICVNRGNTTSTGVIQPPWGSGADGCIIQGLILTGSGTNTAKHGIWLRARASLRDLVVNGFPGNGVNIVATAGVFGETDPLLLGNANNWQIDGLSISGVGRHGVYVAGSDVNAGYGTNISATGCGRYGIYDYSFLGNTYIGCHVTQCGIAGVANNAAGHSSIVNYSNKQYMAMPSATEAQYVATTPGTSEAVWKYDFDIVTADTWAAAQAEGTYFAGGSYRINGDSNGTRMFGIYAEDSQGAADFGPGATVLAASLNRYTQGGAMGAVYGNRLRAKSISTSDGTVGGAMSDPGVGIDLVPDYGTGLLARWYKGTTDDSMSITRSGSDWLIGPYRTTGGTTTEDFKTGAVKTGWPWFNPGFAMGTSTITHRQYTANGVPSSEARAQSDVAWNVRFNATGASTGIAAWVCIDSGTPGTWRVLKLDDYQTVNTDADFTLAATMAETRHTGTLTADRAVTLTVPGAEWTGRGIRITRTGGGAFNLNVGTGPLKALATDTWAEFVFNGTAWYLAAYGAL